jgi:hypothetical protein
VPTRYESPEPFGPIVYSTRSTAVSSRASDRKVIVPATVAPGSGDHI